MVLSCAGFPAKLVFSRAKGGVPGGRIEPVTAVQQSGALSTKQRRTLLGAAWLSGECAGQLYGSPGFHFRLAPLPRPSRKKIICPEAGVRKKEYPVVEHPEEE
jgi:hypothetical protein